MVLPSHINKHMAKQRQQSILTGQTEFFSKEERKKKKKKVTEPKGVEGLGDLLR